MSDHWTRIAAERIEAGEDELECLADYGYVSDERYTLCDCCGSLCEATDDQDAEGNNLGHVQCAQCSRIAELETKLGALQKTASQQDDLLNSYADRLEAKQSECDNLVLAAENAIAEREAASLRLETCVSALNTGIEIVAPLTGTAASELLDGWCDDAEAAIRGPLVPKRSRRRWFRDSEGHALDAHYLDRQRTKS